MTMLIEALMRWGAHPVITWVGVLLGLAGLVFSYIFYVRSRRVRQPVWALRGSNLVRDYTAKFPDLKVLYKDVAIPNLSVSRLVVWNAGRETIRGHDVADADPLRIAPKDEVRILNALTLGTNNEPSQVTLQADPLGNQVLIIFDFLDQYQGALFQVVHTGTSPDDVQVVGTVKGAIRLRRRTPRVGQADLWLPARWQRRMRPATRRKVKDFLLAIFIITFLGGGSVAFLSGFAKIGSIGALILGLSASLATFALITLLCNEVSYVELPNGLDAYEDAL